MYAAVLDVCDADRVCRGLLLLHTRPGSAVISALQNNPIRQRANRGRERVPLHQFLRMIAGRAVIGDRANGSNDELVSNLRRVGVLNS